MSNPVGTTAKHLTKEEQAERQDAARAVFNAPSISPEPPAWLDDTGKQEYRRLVQYADNLTKADSSLLATYCSAYSNYQEAQSQIQAYGVVMTTQAGGLKSNPASAVAAKSAGTMKQIASELGLSVASRLKIELNKQASPEPSPNDPFMKVLNNS